MFRPLRRQVLDRISLRRDEWRSRGRFRRVLHEALEDRSLLTALLSSSSFNEEAAQWRSFTLTEVVAAITDPAPLARLAESLAAEPDQPLAGMIDWDQSKELLQIDGTAVVQLALVEGADPLQAVEALEALSFSQWAAPNLIYLDEINPDPRELIPNDPLYASQYHHPLMRNDLAWDITLGNPGVIIAVTDDGVWLNHEDLASNIWVNNDPINGLDDDANGFIDDINGWDFISNDNNPNPNGSDNHGTHVAGIAAARTDNEIGVAGTAGASTIMPLKFYNGATPSAWTSTVILNSYKYAVDNGAKIISTSYNVDGFVNDPTFVSALNYVYNAGVLHLNSAGNNNQLNPPRQSLDQSLYVANTNSADIKSGSSNYGFGIDISAPGSSILSTLSLDSYGSMSGTSMATPNAAGTAALIWSAHPTWTRDQVAAQLIGTADDIDAANPAFAGLLGSGRANSFRAIVESLAAPQIEGVPGLPSEGSTTFAAISSFSVDLAHVLDPATVALSNFELRGDGADGAFDTTDDVLLPLALPAGFVYRVGTNRLSFTNSGMGPDRYRFRAVSGGLRDPFGSALDGNADGLGGDHFERTFSFEVPATISGQKFRDANANGLKDLGEPGLPGWTIYLDLNNNGVLEGGGVEPDNYAAGTILNTVVPQATLRAIGISGTDLSPNTVVSSTGAFASTGTRVFGSSAAGSIWTDDSNRLRIDFLTPVSSVSIDAISDDSLDIGRLEIYNGSNVLLATILTGNLAAGQVGTMTATRPTADIAYAIASGHNGQFLLLDNLRLGGEPVRVTDDLGNYSFVDIDAGTYTVREVPQTGWTQSAPAAGFHSVTVAAGQIVGGVDFGNRSLEVVSTVPPFPGGFFTLPAPLTYDINFSEPIAASSVGTDDLSLNPSVGSVTGAIALDADTARYTISGISAEGGLTITLLTGAVTNTAGNPIPTAFSASYIVDSGTVPYPVPLTPKNPLGSLIYDPSVSGTINFAGDVDTYSLELDANQDISVRAVAVTTGLQPSITVRSPTGASLGSVTASNQPALLQTLTAATAGVYTIEVRGGSSTTGSYTLQVTLNAALEREGDIVGILNNTTGTAQDINASFVTVSNPAAGVLRAAVLGTTEASYLASVVTFGFTDISVTGTNIINNNGLGANDVTATVNLPFSFNFLGSSFTSLFVSDNGLITFGTATTSGTNNSLSGNPTQAAIAPFWDALQLFSGTAARVKSQLIGAVGSRQLILQWDKVNFAGANSSDTLTFQAILFEGSNNIRFNYLDLVSGSLAGNQGGSATVGVKRANPTGAQLVELAFNNGPNTFVGNSRSTLLTPGVPPDHYTLPLTSGETTTVAVTAQGAGSLNVELLNSAGAVIATGVSGAINVGSLISNFPITTTAGYFVRVSGQGNVPYSLMVTRNAAFDTEGNSTLATAQNIGAARGALGYIAGTSSATARVGYFTDFASSTTFPATAITQAGFTPIQITNISTFDLGTIDILMVNESDNFGLSAAMSARLPSIQTWVQSGGVFMVHDRFVSTSTGPNPFLLGAAGAVANKNLGFGTNLDVIPPGGTLVTSGPFGTITNTSLDGGNSSNHGWVTASTLPPGTATILSAGPDPANAAAFSYSLGSGRIYYSTIPLDFYLSQSGSTQPSLNFRTVYTPNTLHYVNSFKLPDEDWYAFDVTDLTNSFRLATSTPADGPGEFANTLNPQIELYDPAGNPVGSRVILSDGRNESIDYLPLVAGLYRVRVTSEGNTRGEYFLGKDNIAGPPRVVATSIAPGATLTSGTFTYQVTFSEPMKVTNLTADDYALFGTIRATIFGTTSQTFGATSASFSPDGSVLILSYTSVPDDVYTLTLDAGVSGGTNFTDVAGNALDGEFTGEFDSGDGLAGGDLVVGLSVDFVTEGLITPLESMPPLGSLVYDPELTRVIVSGTDTDNFTVSLDPGQRITVLVTALSPGVQPTVQLRNSSGTVLGTATALAPGQHALLQSIAGAASGQYTVAVNGAGGTTGVYIVQLALNAALEAANIGIGSNKTRATAQDLNPTIANVQTTQAAAGRGAVMGSLASGTVTVNAIDSGFWESTGAHAWINKNFVAGKVGAVESRDYFVFDLTSINQPIAAAQLRLQNPANGFSSADGNETYTLFDVLDVAALRTNGSGPGSLAVFDDLGSGTSLGSRDFSSADNATITVTSLNADGLAALNGALGEQVALGGAVTTINPLGGNQNVFGNSGAGFTRQLVLTIPSADSDFYSFTLAAGQIATVLVKNLSGGGTTIAIQDATGSTLASSVPGVNLDQIISNFVAPAAGTYYIVVSSSSTADYNLVVTRNAAFDTEPNDTFATAQPIDGYRGVLGGLPSGVVPPSVATVDAFSNTSTPFNIGSTSTARYQQIYSRTEFSQPGTITAVRFRRNQNEPPIQLGTTLNIRMTIGYAATTVATVSTTFAANVDTNPGRTIEVVNSTALPFESGPTTGNPNPFDVVITFDEPFDYDPREGDLLLDISLPSGATSRLFDLSTSGQQSTTRRVFATGATGVTATTGTVESSFTGLVTQFEISTPKEDWYSFDITDTSTPFRLETSTPADASLHFINLLNPHIELFDPGGNLVATGVPTTTGGRNEFIAYQPGQTGLYRVRMTAEGGTAGEYFLTKSNAPSVTAISIAPGELLTPGTLNFQVTFSEPMLSANLSSGDDFTLRGNHLATNYLPVSFQYNADRTVLYVSYDFLPDDNYTLTLIPGAPGGANFTDVDGTPLDGEFSGSFPSGNGSAGGNFVLNFSMNPESEAYRFTPQPPAGSLIYDPALRRAIAPADDTDTFTVAVDPGQTIAVLVTPLTPGLVPMIQLLDPDGALVATATAEGTDQAVVLQAMAADTAAAGVYSIVVSDASSATGHYEIQILLNAALELAGPGLGSNKTPGTAQHLDASFIELAAGSASASRGAVRGSVGSITLSAIDSGWWNHSGSHTATNNNYLTGLSGTTTFRNFFVFDLATVNVPVAGAAMRLFLPEGDGYNGGTTETLTLFDVSTSLDDLQADGTARTDIFADLGTGAALGAQSYSDVDEGRIKLRPLPLNSDGVAALNVAGTGLIAFGGAITSITGTAAQNLFASSGPAGNRLDTRLLDLTVAADSDYYAFTLAAGQKAMVSLTDVTGSGTTLAIQDEGGMTLATGSGGSLSLDQMIRDFRADAAGTYYIVVSSLGSAATYHLVVTRDASLEAENNDSLASAQPLTGSSGVLGALEPYSVLVPSQFAEEEANASNGFPFNLPIHPASSMRYQQIYSRAEFSEPGTITALRFRRNGGTLPFSSPGLDLQINLSHAATTFETVSATFATNIGDDETTVFDSAEDGLVTLSSSAVGRRPYEFDIVIPLATPFFYDPSQGELLVEVLARNAVLTEQFELAHEGTQSVTRRVWAVDDIQATTGTIDFSSVPGYGGLLTMFDFAPDEDWYSVQVTAEFPNLRLQTSTPADGPNEFANALNPRIELYGPGNALILPGAVTADGRNESIEFHAPGLVPGTYRIRVTRDENTTGEYFLGVTTLPNETPTAADDAATTDEDTAVLIDVLANDEDPEGPLNLTSVIATDAAHGSVSVNDVTGAITYEPDPDYSGPDSFTYTVKDDNGAVSNVATVTLTVVAVADTPSLSVSDVTGDEAAAIPLAITSALSDTDGSESLSIQITGVPALAQLSAGTNDGGSLWTLSPTDLVGLTITYPDDATFTLVVTATATESSNGDDASTTASFQVTVNNVNPVILTLAANNADENGIVTLSGAYSDVGSLDTHELTIDWGEGAPETYVVTGGSFDITHQYLDDNPTLTASDSYTINVTLTDDDMGTDNASAAATITNVNPIITNLTSSSPDCGGAFSNTSIFGCFAGQGGEAVTVSGSFTDVGTLDTHSAVIDWGDGTTSPATITEVNGSGTFSGSHTYESGGLFTITVTLTDDDAGSDTETAGAMISGIGLDPSGRLVVVGTDGRDSVTVFRGLFNTIVVVALFDQSYHPFFGYYGGTIDIAAFPASQVSSIYMQLCDGDDYANVVGTIGDNDDWGSDGGFDHDFTGIQVPATILGEAGNDTIYGGDSGDFLDGGSGNNKISGRLGSDTITAGDGNNTVYGGGGDDSITTGGGADKIWGDDGADRVRAGSGNDTVYGGSGNDVLLGEDGNDTLKGDDGRDILIGGRGADKLIGNMDSDLLIAGYTAHDANDSALSSMMSEWSSSGSYNTRVANLIAGTGLAGGYRLNGDDGGLQTVFNDSSIDTLIGSQGQDWFLANRTNDNGGPLDIVDDKASNETWTDTDL